MIELKIKSNVVQCYIMTHDTRKNMNQPLVILIIASVGNAGEEDRMTRCMRLSTIHQLSCTFVARPIPVLAVGGSAGAQAVALRSDAHLHVSLFLHCVHDDPAILAWLLLDLERFAGSFSQFRYEADGLLSRSGICHAFPLFVMR